MKTTVTFVIGANASGKSFFIENHFSDSEAVILNVYDYQQSAYKEAGFDEISIPFDQEFKCLYKANADLLTDVINNLKLGKDVVVEQTFFKAKRRIAYIDAINDAVEDVVSEVYVMCPSDFVWENYLVQRRLGCSFERLKENAKELEFPNPAEGFDKIYKVTDGNIALEMGEADFGIVESARKELYEEAERIRKEKEKTEAEKRLLERMNTEPFWHYCEVCGKKEFITAKEAFDEGWDYPPEVGRFGLLGPRTCGSCDIKSTLYWKVQKQAFPIVIEGNLADEEKKTWKRIRNEPESLLNEEE